MILCFIRYNLKLYNVKSPIKDGLQEFLSLKPEIKAVLMGNRKTDPKSHDLQIFQVGRGLVTLDLNLE